MEEEEEEVVVAVVVVVVVVLVVVVEVEVSLVVVAAVEDELEENVEPSKEVAADCFSPCKGLRTSTVEELCIRDRFLVRLR